MAEVEVAQAASSAQEMTTARLALVIFHPPLSNDSIAVHGLFVNCLYAIAVDIG